MKRNPKPEPQKAREWWLCPSCGFSTPNNDPDHDISKSYCNHNRIPPFKDVEMILVHEILPEKVEKK